MAWIKIPKEHHPIFLDALPLDDRLDTKTMFGSVVAMVNGWMMGGLWAHTFMVRVGPADYEEGLALGGDPFDPMGHGKAMASMVTLPESVFRDRKALRRWLEKALAFTASLPPKKTASKKASPARKAPPEQAAKAQKKAPKRPAPTRSAPKRSAPRR